jgi:hypothetical protein
MMINIWLFQNMTSLSLLAQTTAETEVTSNPLFSLFSLISYIFGSFCFWKIYQKLNESNAWFAWLPILGQWKMYQAGGQSPWWVIGLFIPIVNIVALVFLIMALIKIVKRLGKNPWLILLMIIPLVNFWVLYHFAFQ